MHLNLKYFCFLFYFFITNRQLCTMWKHVVYWPTLGAPSALLHLQCNDYIFATQKHKSCHRCSGRTGFRVQTQLVLLNVPDPEFSLNKLYLWLFPTLKSPSGSDLVNAEVIQRFDVCQSNRQTYHSRSSSQSAHSEVSAILLPSSSYYASQWRGKLLVSSDLWPTLYSRNVSCYLVPGFVTPRLFFKVLK
jgi:hypothetical protein